MTSGQNDDIWDTSLPFAQETAACDRSVRTATGPEWTSAVSSAVCDQTRSTATNPDGTAGFSSSLEKKGGGERGEFLYYRADPSMSINRKRPVESDIKKSEIEGTLNSVDIQSAFTEELVPITGTRFNPYQSLFNQSQHYPNIKSMKEIVNVVRSYVIALICTLLKAVLAYNLVLRSNLSCVQRTYVGLWRPNEHCDY